MAGEDEFSAAVRQAAERREVAAAVETVCQELADEIVRRRPVCLVSGRCCRFEEYGHRMFVTTMELAAFLGQLRKLRPGFGKWDGVGCPFQVGKLCGVHPIRPMGCRIFFCDATAGQWQQDVYERFHARLKRLHEEMDVKYFYVEWREGLARLGEIP